MENNKSSDSFSSMAFVICVFLIMKIVFQLILIYLEKQNYQLKEDPSEMQWHSEINANDIYSNSL